MLKIFTLVLGMIVYCLGLFGKVTPGVAAVCCIAGIFFALSVDLFNALSKPRKVFNDALLFALAAIGALSINHYAEAGAAVLLYNASAWLFPWLLKRFATQRKPPQPARFPHRRWYAFLRKINRLFPLGMIAAAIVFIILSFFLSDASYTWFSRALVCLLAAAPITYTDALASVTQVTPGRRVWGMSMQLFGKIAALSLGLFTNSPWVMAAGDTAVKLAITGFLLLRGETQRKF